MSDLTYLGLKERLTLQAEEQGIPLSGGFELTARCNFQCGMCYVRRPMNDRSAINHELSAEQWIDLARQARDAGMLFVLLSGGDIFVREDVRDIYEGVFDLGLIPSIYTNGSLITPEVVRWLIRRPPEYINITLYGASSHTYESVCGVKCQYEKVLRNIGLLKDAGLNLGISTTVISKNVNDYDALQKISDELGLPLKYSGYISPVRVDTGSSIAENRLSPAELVSYITKFNRDFVEKHKDVANSTLCRSETGNSELKRKSSSVAALSNFPCQAGKSTVWINWRGQMAGCPLMQDKYSKPVTYGFSKAWKILRVLLQEIPECSDCKNCEQKSFCMACPARLKNETGEYGVAAEYLCELAKYSQHAKGEMR